MKIILIFLIFLSTNIFALEIIVKSKQYNNATVVKALIGNKVEFHKLVKLQKENHITNIKIIADDKLVLNMKVSKNISAKPTLKFKYKNIDTNSLHVEIKRVDGSIEKYTKKVKKVDRDKVLKPYLKLKNNPKKYKIKAKAIKKVFGDIELIENGIELIVPERASWGGRIPVSIHSNIKAKSIVLFAEGENKYAQDYSPIIKGLKFTSQWFQTPYSIIDYYLNIKMGYSGEVRVVIQAKDGKFYTATKHVKVEIAGGN